MHISIYNFFDTLLPFFFVCSSQIFVIHECKGLSFINLLVLKHRRSRIERLQVEDGQGKVNSAEYVLPAMPKGSTLTSLRFKSVLHMKQMKPYIDCSFSRGVKNLYFVINSKLERGKKNTIGRWIKRFKVWYILCMKYFMYSVSNIFSDVALNVSLRNTVWVKFF